ncbi:MAG: choice-of-anchor A family protein [Erysipelotrichaceae bacterium]
MAINFWLANEFNIFVFENQTQSNAYATGSVWVGKDALLTNYEVGKDLPVVIEPYRFSIRVLGNMNINKGINYSQNSGIDNLGTVTHYSMVNQNGVPNNPLKFEYRPYDIYAYNYLECSSIGWSLIKNGEVKQTGTTLSFIGTDSAINSFQIDTSIIDLSSITIFDFIVPEKSTVIINLLGSSMTLNPIVTLFNGVAISKEQSAYVLYNVPQATTLNIKTDLYGSLLAAKASISSSNIVVYGTLMTRNLSGSLNGVMNNFLGQLPDLYNPSTTGSCSTASHTSSTTSSTSTTTVAPVSKKEQAINDLFESIALQQTGISHILNAEGEKIQNQLSRVSTIEDLLILNASIKSMVDSLTRLELMLQAKLAMFEACSCKQIAKK